ncbi:serine hydrolase domain-containing protein [Maricaulis sp. MIT060901]|uniref:serine hydrolase domain-containing protein n=1 Tax=Maricaulis sp. MIT060901 TaxID=3096993 RepID=UPI00399B0512
MAVWLVPGNSAAQAAPALQDDAVQAISRLVEEMVEPGQPGAGVGIVLGGDVVFSHYAGLANLDTPTPIDASTRFNIASVAKQYTALMVLELAQSGRVDLSQDFRTYLPGVMEGIDPPISVGQLINHTSGIRDVYDLYFITNATWYETDFDNRTALTLLNRQVALNFEPGTDYRYSNSNYILLAELVSAVVDEPFHVYATRFLSERGLGDSSIRRRYGVVIPRLARAYGNYGSGWLEDADIANTQGDGFMYASLPDLLRWETQIWGADRSLPDDLIEMSQRPIEGLSNPAYGYGLEFGFYRGARTVFHEGATGSYNTHVLRFPDFQASIVVVSNNRNISAVALAVRTANLAFDNVFTDAATYPAGPDVISDIGSLDGFLGLYELDSGTFVRLVSRDGDLFREIEWREPVRLIPEADNLYHYETNPNLRLTLTQSAEGRRGFALYAPSQSPQFAQQVPPTPDEETYPASIEGRYFNAETETEIILQHTADGEYVMVKNDRPRTLQLVGRDYLTWNDYRIRVVRDGRGLSTGLTVDRNRVRNLDFPRQD